MKFGGLQTHSLIDFPQTLACVVFLAGCNFRCPFCHNPDLAKIAPDTQREIGEVDPGNRSHLVPECDPEIKAQNGIDEIDFFSFLEERRGFIDGVVLSGGEPTLCPDLKAMCTRIKEMGYQLKLDTNGSKPSVTAQLIEAELLDYIAMDVKSDPDRYPAAVGRTVNLESILESIHIIMKSGLPYEFRTTCVSSLVDDAAVACIARTIKGAQLYALQHFRHERVLSPAFFKTHTHRYTSADLMRMQSIASPWVKKCIIR